MSSSPYACIYLVIKHVKMWNCFEHLDLEQFYRLSRSHPFGLLMRVICLKLALSSVFICPMLAVAFVFTILLIHLAQGLNQSTSCYWCLIFPQFVLPLNVNPLQ